jgi:hypothetical protein
MADAPALRPLSLGEVLDVSFGLYRSLFVPLVVVAVICQAIPMTLGVYLGASRGLFVNIAMSLLYVALAAILGSIGVAASTFVVSDAYLGREISATVALQRATALLGRLIVISILTSILVGLGFMLLIVPGVILLSGLVLSTVVAVLESPPSATAAMGRSWDLTRGFRSKVFLTMVVAFLLLLVPGIAIGGAGALFGDPEGAAALAILVLEAVLQIFIYPFAYVVMTVLYYDLRVRKEGFDLELLASSLQPA